MVKKDFCQKLLFFYCFFVFSQLMQELDEIKSSNDTKDELSQDTKKTSTKGYNLIICIYFNVAQRSKFIFIFSYDNFLSSVVSIVYVIIIKKENS